MLISVTRFRLCTMGTPEMNHGTEKRVCIVLRAALTAAAASDPAGFGVIATVLSLHPQISQRYKTVPTDFPETDPPWPHRRVRRRQ
jgi:hypothetical protein